MKKVKVLSVAVAAILAVAPVATTTVANSSSVTVEAAIHHKRGKKVTKKARRHVKKHAKKRTKVKAKGVDWKHTPYGDLTDLPMKDRLKVMNGTESAGYLRTIAKNNRNLDYTGLNADVVNPITGEK